MATVYGDVSVHVANDFVATVELHRPPNNYFDLVLVRSLADALESVDAGHESRAVVLCSVGKHFCAGADFTGRRGLADNVGGGGEEGHIYEEALRLFTTKTPIVAAVQGTAIGGGLGLAMAADFRVASPETRFAANFARLGFHHGFGLTVTLPAAIGRQRALEMLYTGQRVPGEEALRIGLCDRLVPADSLREAAHTLAAEIAVSAPLAMRSIRETMRGDLAARVKAAAAREWAEQERLAMTDDFSEGLKATAERRTPRFSGH